MADPQVKGVIEARVSDIVDDLVDQLRSSYNTVIQIGGNVQRFQLSSATANLLAHAVVDHTNDLDTVQRDLQNHIRSLDIKIVEAVKKLLESQRAAEQKVEQAEDKVRKYNEDSESLQKEREKVSDVIRRLQDTYDNQVEHIRTLHEEMQSLTQSHNDLISEFRNDESRRLTKLQKELDDCRAHRAIAQAKAAEYEKMLSRQEDTERLQVRTHDPERQLTERGSQLGISTRQRSERITDRQALTPASSIGTRRSAAPLSLRIQGESPTPSIQVTSEANSSITPSTTAGTFPERLSRAQGPTESSFNRTLATASQARAVSRAAPSTPVASAFPTTSATGSIRGQKRPRNTNTPDVGRKLRLSGGAKPTETIHVEETPMDQTSAQEDPSHQVTEVQGALERVELYGETDRPIDESHEDTEMADNSLMGEDGDEDQAESTQAGSQDRVTKLRNGTILPHSGWKAPGAPSTKGIPSQADQFFAAIRKPANWDEDANKALLEAIPKVKSSLGPVVEEFHAQKDCMLSRLQRDAVGPPIPDDQTEPCANCQEADRPCFGARILPDTTAPKNKFDQVRKTPRLKFGRDANGYYWELKYRPARGPDDDATGGGSGGIATA